MSELPVAIGRGDVADYVDTLILVYILLIFIRIVVSWFRSIPYHPWLSALLTFVHDVTEPYLRLFRRIIPMARVGPAALDLSPIVGILVLSFGGAIITNLIRG